MQGQKGMGESSSSSVPNQVSQNRVDPKMNPTHGHNLTVNPSTIIGMKPSNYASSSSGPVEMEDRQLPRKRKAAELDIGQSSSGIESSSIFQRPEGSNRMWQSVSENPTPTNTLSFDPIIPRLGSGIGGVSENIRRNVRVRINNPRQQDQLPVNNNNNNNDDNNGLLNFSSPYPSLGLNPVPTTGDSSSVREGQPMLRAPSLTRSLYASRIRSSSLRANRPVSSNIVGSPGDHLRTPPINISDHRLFVPPHDIRNIAQTQTQTATASNPIPNAGPHRISSLYASRRRSELLRRHLLSMDSGAAGIGGEGGQSRNLFSRIPPPVHASTSLSQDTGIPPGIAIAGHHPHHHLARTVAGGSERRGRLVSEMRNVLDLIRRGEGLRFEDFMILDQSVFYGMAGIHDRHRDMRLDIDNMSYEELLALEERIGNVNTGLTEDNIHKHLKQKTFVSAADAVPCCICQEEYKEGDDLGALECGHEFHKGCIKQWLLQKNACPVCKSEASK